MRAGLMHYLVLFLSPCLLVPLSPYPHLARADNPIDSAMDHDPELPLPRVVTVFPKGAVELWVRALDHPDAETKVAAAQSIALAHRQGMPGLGAAVPTLVRELDRPGQHPTVRLAVAHALVALDAQSAAENLFRQLREDDPELRELIEPALARWDYGPARVVWLERIGQGSPYRRRHLLAIQALGAVREEKAVPRLRELALSATTPAPVRLEAARALAAIRPARLEKDAAALAADTSPHGIVARLAAASLLRNHAGDEAVRLLQSLGRDSEPAVAVVAVARLVELDTKLVLPLLQAVLASPDAGVRQFGVEVLFREPTDDHVRLLGDRLSDPHPDVRGRARRALHELAARSEFREWVIHEGTRALAGTDWRGQEQAAVLLAELGHKPATKRMLELLWADRPEALVAAAWGLRKLAVPDTLVPVLDFVGTHHRKMLASGSAAGRSVPPDAIDRQLAQLVQFLGQARYRPADGRLREMLPRLVPGQPGNPPQTPVGVETRAAVAWALGLLHEGKPDADVGRALAARLTDVATPAGAEYDRVRGMAAVSLGRMKDKNAAPTLRRFYAGKPTLDPVNNACGWALAQITGEPVPPPGTVEQRQPAWFLSSIE
jgi:HEAT repeat protein